MKYVERNPGQEKTPGFAEAESMSVGKRRGGEREREIHVR